MKTKSTFWKNSLIFGIITGIVLILYSYLLTKLELDQNKALLSAAYLIIIASLVIGIKNYRDKHSSGTISYGGSLGFSMIIISISALFTSIYTYVFLNNNPEIIERSRITTENEFIAKGMSDMQIEMATKFISAEFSAGSTLLSYLLMGFVIALIISAIMKKGGDPYQQAMQDINEE
ncbi:MAG: DUF4199 domain-containing protein [Bacteroidales bacterium]|nr:DUF4199 domain-containing protein [Bacteroidales bacterium]